MAKSDDNVPIDREMFWYCQNVCFGELCWWMVGWRVENYWTRIFAHQSFILRQRQKIGDQRFLSDVRLCVRWMNWWSMTMDCDDDGPALVCELMMTEYLSGSGDKAKLTHDHHGYIKIIITGSGWDQDYHLIMMIIMTATQGRRLYIRQSDPLLGWADSLQYIHYTPPLP